MNTNPFDRVNMGYDGLFGPRTMFYHLQPSSNGSLVEQLSVPVLDLAGTKWVESGTVGVILLGFTWVCWNMAQILIRNSEWKKRRSAKED